MTLLDIAALVVFTFGWLGYEALLHVLTRGRGALNDHMEVIRHMWMRRMLAREVRIADTNIIGNLLNTASFFASTSLIVIAAASGVLFGGEETLKKIAGLGMVQLARAPTWVLEAKIALVIVALSRGLLSFIWSIRQLNYGLAIIGAAPDSKEERDARPFVSAASKLINNAVASFNSGVRGYYFAMAAAAWLVSPIALMIASAGAVALLAWRQARSEAAKSVQAVHDFLMSETDEPVALALEARAGDIEDAGRRRTVAPPTRSGPEGSSRNG